MRPAGTADLPYRAITFVHVPPQGFEPCSTDQESATSPQCFGGLSRGEPRNRTRWGLHPWLLSTQLPSPCGRSPSGRVPCGTRTRCFALKGRPLNPSRYGTCVTQEGFEPPTLRISDGSSTRLSYCVKDARRSPSRAHAPKAGIEPTDTWARTRLVAITTRDCDVRQAGVEPATSSFSERRSPG